MGKLTEGTELIFRNKRLPTIVIFVVGTLLFLAGSRPVIAATPNGIVRPGDGAIIGGVTSVTGIADDPNFLAWQLDLLPLADPQTTIFVQRGTTRTPALSRIGSLDTALYPNGEYRLRLRVITTDSNYTEYYATILIDNGPLGSNRITDPVDGAKLACLATVRGIAHSDEFRNWQLDILLGGDENKAVMLDRGSQQRYFSGSLDQFDTSQFPDGNHLLRLRVVRRDGNYDAYYTQITIDNTVMTEPLKRNGCSCAAAIPDVPSVEPNNITNPPNAATVSGLIPICGTADDPNFDAWQLDLLFEGDENQSVLIGHGQNSTGARAPLVLLDTTALPDGKYGLRLSVGRADYTVDTHTIIVCVMNQSSVPGLDPAGCATSSALPAP